jgi:hypothetical protein
MRAHLMAALVAASLALLTACVMTPTQPEPKAATIPGKPSVDVGYLQFAMSGEAGNGFAIDYSVIHYETRSCSAAGGFETP